MCGGEGDCPDWSGLTRVCSLFLSSTVSRVRSETTPPSQPSHGRTHFPPFKKIVPVLASKKEHTRLSKSALATAPDAAEGPLPPRRGVHRSPVLRRAACPGGSASGTRLPQASSQVPSHSRTKHTHSACSHPTFPPFSKAVSKLMRPRPPSQTNGGGGWRRRRRRRRRRRGSLRRWAIILGCRY